MGSESGIDIFSLFLAIVAVVPIGLVVLGILVFASGREPDSSGRRPYAVYLCTVSFTAMFVALLAGFALLSSLVGLAIDTDDEEQSLRSAPAASSISQAGDPGGDSQIVDPPGEFEPPPGEYDYDDSGEFDDSEEFNYDDSGEFMLNEDSEDAAVRDSVSSSLVLLAAGLLFIFHRRKLAELRSTPGYQGSPAGRVESAYMYATCFVAVIGLVGAAVVAAYGIFQIIAPGVASSYGVGARKDGVTPLITAGALALATYLIAWKHWTRATELREGTAAPASADLPEGGTQI